MIDPAESASQLHLQVRVNPANVDLTPENPEYVARHDGMVTLQEASYMKHLGAQAVACGPKSPDTDMSEEALRFIAHSAAERDFTIQAVLGGYGLADTEGMWYHGADITYVEDESVPYGNFAIEGAQDPVEIVSQLRTLC